MAFKNATTDQADLPWDLEVLYLEPRVFPCPEMSDGNVQALFYEGLPYQRKRTRVFAYYALPETSVDKKVPGVVLVHGGGGTAFKEWVRIWADRGYAAIAMDLEGHLPTEKNSDGAWPSHDWSGPFRSGVFADYELPTEDQWMYHAVANVLLANSFLRSIACVDNTKIGVHGISWGGIVTSAVAGIDERFAFAIPIYGCGYLYEASNQYGQSFAAMPPEIAQKVKRRWDPSAYFDRVQIPMLWVNWTDDHHFPLHLFSKSYLAVRQGSHHQSHLSLQFGLGHSHSAGWKPKEIYTFADQITRGTQDLPQIASCESKGTAVKVHVTSQVPVVHTELRYATDTSDWFKIEWFIHEASYDSQTHLIHAEIPENAVAFFIQITDERGCLVSTPVHELASKQN